LSTSKADGFTLLEIMLVLVIMASTAMVVVMILPANNALLGQAEKVKSLMEYAAEHATLTSKPTGFSMMTNGYQMVVLETTQPLIPTSDEPQWKELAPLHDSKIVEFPEDMLFTLSPQGLNKSPSQPPQIIFMPDGTTTRFSLVFFPAAGEEPCCEISSEGGLPLKLEVKTPKK